MLAANGCMLGLHFTPGMTMENCLLDIVDPRREILGARRRFTNRQLDTMIISSINAENVEVLKILLKVRFSPNDRKIVALVSRNDEALQYFYFWAGIQRGTPPEVRLEIFGALNSAPRNIPSLELPTKQQLIFYTSASSFLGNFRKYFLDNDLDNVAKMLREVPFILFGDGKINSPNILAKPVNVDVSILAAITVNSKPKPLSHEIHKLILENGFVPSLQMVRFLFILRDMDMFKAYLRYGPLQSMFENLIWLAFVYNSPDFFEVILDAGGERLSQDHAELMINNALRTEYLGILNILTERNYNLSVGSSARKAEC